MYFVRNDEIKMLNQLTNIPRPSNVSWGHRIGSTKAHMYYRHHCWLINKALWLTFESNFTHELSRHHLLTNTRLSHVYWQCSCHHTTMEFSVVIIIDKSNYPWILSRSKVIIKGHRGQNKFYPNFRASGRQLHFNFTYTEVIHKCMKGTDVPCYFPISFVQFEGQKKAKKLQFGSENNSGQFQLRDV